MARRSHEADDPRRAFLLRALATGVLAAAGVPGARAQIFGRRPQPLPAGRSVYEAIGKVTVNGQPVAETTRIGAGARIETGAGAQLVFVVGSDAFLMRQNGRLELAGEGFVVGVMEPMTP